MPPMVKIYGMVQSRAYRCLWMARELGIELESIPTHFGAEAKTPEFLAINPNGKVPALQDGDLVLWESMAINFYLAKRYGGELAPQTLAEEAHALKWSFWAVAECELDAIHLHDVRVLGISRFRTATAEETEEKLRKSLRVLDGELQDRRYLLGDRFTVADLNVASILSPAKAGRLSFETLPHAKRWLGECFRRPAQKETIAAF